MRFLIPTVVAGMLALGGCAGTLGGSDLEGTWRSTTEPGGTPFELASVTFADDGTYTAQVAYDQEQRGASGEWTLNDSTLRITGREGTRTYRVEQPDDDTLVITDQDSQRRVVMARER